MTPPRSLASNAANVVFAPPIVAYGLIVVDYKWSGICLYVLTLACAYKLRFFARFGEWPRVSRFTVFAGALLIGIGFCFRLSGVVSYWLLFPCAVYALLAMVAGLALRSLV